MSILRSNDSFFLISGTKNSTNQLVGIVVATLIALDLMEFPASYKVRDYLS